MNHVSADLFLDHGTGIWTGKIKDKDKATIHIGNLTIFVESIEAADALINAALEARRVLAPEGSVNAHATTTGAR